MALEVGTRLGAYEITGELGAGGMGEVYRATDTSLKREVAMKVLPPAFAEDADRVARFQREAEALAALNHPNIAQIYGIERSGETTALAMELVEGPTLADRIADGPLPTDEALHIAMQIADALEAAHEQNIVHRDLKPANVKLRPDGTVKVLDFGIATAPESPVATSGRRSPTLLTPALTEMGVLLGTAAYMAPEQARGRAVDRRADIWAFGCVLYEMLTGQPAFGGEDVTTTLARVLEREANTAALPATVPSAVQHTIGLCLQKDVKKRLRDIGDVKLALEGAFETAPSDTTAKETVVRPLWRRALPLVAAVVVTGVVAALVGWALWPIAPPRPVNRFYYDVPGAQTFRNAGRPVMALSPDGRRFVYNAPGGLYLRSMGELDARVIPGTEEQLTSPFFSPDGQSVAYFAGQMKRIAISGGAAVVIADGLSNLFGASWGADGTILYGQPQGIFRVSATGGKPELVIPAKEGETLYGPELLPDGDSVLFSATTTGTWDDAEVVAQSLSTGQRTVLVQGGNDAHYVEGRLVYALGDGLFGIAFDPKRLAVSGGAVPLVQGVMRAVNNNTAAANYGVSNEGTLVYVAGNAPRERHMLVWVDRDGREEPINAPARNYQYAQLSPDGTRIALDSRDEENDIWIWDLERKTLQRLTFDPGFNRMPVWSPDGRRVAFTRQLDNTEEIYWQAADGSGSPEPLTKDSPAGAFASALSPDGTTLLYQPVNGRFDLLSVSVKVPPSAGKPLLASSSASESNGTISPDGQWLAYQSDESGQYEVYVRPYPDVNSGRWQISTAGGTRPHWSRDGRELFYFVMNQMVGPVANQRTGTVAAVPIEPGSTFKAGDPKKLFPGPYLAPNYGRGVYDVSADGKRFLMIKDAEAGAQARQPQIIVVQNWVQELKRLVPTK